MTQFIKELRIKKGVNQQELADMLGITRQTFSKMEIGQVEPTLGQAVKLAEFFGIELEKLLPEDTEIISSNEIDREKYKQIIKIFIKYGSDNDGKITKTKLAKLCYLLDFTRYYNNLKPITGLEYRRIQQGPVPDAYFRTIEELRENESISVESRGKAYMIENIEEPKNDKLSQDEFDLLEKIAKKWKNKDTQEIVNFTHNQLPWLLCKDKEIIPYNLITQEEFDNIY